MSKAYELKYKVNPRGRKVSTAVQFHNSEAEAMTNGQNFIRAYYPEAIVLSATPRPDVDQGIANGTM